MSCAKRIRDLREDRDLSQKQLAMILGTSQTVYSRYERDERKLPTDILIKQCKFYNTSEDYILGFTNIKKALPKK